MSEAVSTELDAWLRGLSKGAALAQDKRAIERCATSFALAAENPWAGRDADSAWLRLGAELATEDATPSLLARCVAALGGTHAASTEQRLNAQAALFEGYHRTQRDRARERADQAWLGESSVVLLGAEAAAVPSPPFARELTFDADTARVWAESVAAVCAKRHIKRVFCSVAGPARTELTAALGEIGAAIVDAADVAPPNPSPSPNPNPAPEATKPTARRRFWPFA
jgi:hypothetical protein